MENYDELIARISDLEARVTRLEGEPAVDKRSTLLPKHMSIKEYLLKARPTSAIETTFFIGAYLEKVKTIVEFTIDDLRNGFREAKVPAPSNINDMVNKNISKGYFMESGTDKAGRKAWTLTMSGEQLAQNRVNKEDDEGR